jgi:DNA-binding MarR family transcriptional regulator
MSRRKKDDENGVAEDASVADVHFNPHVPGIDYDVLDGLIGYSIRRSQLIVYEDFIRMLAPWDITPPRFTALTIISKNPGIKPIDLAKVVGIARSGGVLLINSLEQRGLVERRPSKTDKRAVGIFLTRAGATTLREVTAVVLEQDARVSAHLSQKEQQTLLKLLRKFAKIG